MIWKFCSKITYNLYSSIIEKNTTKTQNDKFIRWHLFNDFSYYNGLPSPFSHSYIYFRCWYLDRVDNGCFYLKKGCVPYLKMFSKTKRYIFLLAMSVGQRLYINFSIPIPANFLATLRSHLNVTCFCYFWFSLRMNVMYN